MDKFKEDAVQYRNDDPELTLHKTSENIGISESVLKNWLKSLKEQKGIASETSGFCQWDVAQIGCFTFWLQCMENTYSF